MLQVLELVRRCLKVDFYQGGKGVQSNLIMPKNLGTKKEVHLFETFALDCDQFRRDGNGQSVSKIPPLLN